MCFLGVGAINAFANCTTSSTPTVSISSPVDGSTVSDNHVLMTGIVSAIGGGQGVDVMLVMDNSSSLTNTDPTKERFDAVRQVLDTLDANANVNMGLIYFNGSASLGVSLQSVGSSKSLIKTSMNNTSPYGSTNSASGINMASEQLESKGRPNASHVIIVFTDGLDGSPQNAEVAAKTAFAKGQVVHVVGLLSQDPTGKSDAQNTASNGGGLFFDAASPIQLASIFRDTKMLAIDRVEVKNTTSGISSANVSFATGNFSANVDLVEGNNLLKVTAYDTSGQCEKEETVTVIVPRTCPDSNIPGTSGFVADCSITPSYIVKLRPQVLMAGFDPMLLDIGDDEFKVMAVIREGAQPIRHVTLSENTGSFSLAMNLEGELSNGDKVYSLTMLLPARALIGMDNMLSNLFGGNQGEYKITVIDEASEEHSFPHLSFGNNQDVPRDNALTSTSKYSTKGIRRGKPQVLLAGFDPVLIDLTDSSFKVKAIVRRGSTNIRSVSLKTNNNFFAVKMSKEEDLGNGDEMWSTVYTFPRGAFPAGVFKDLFGTYSESEFVVEAKDEASQNHIFPALKIGDYPSIQ